MNPKQKIKIVHSKVDPHLGGNVRWGDAHTFSPRAWDYLLKRFCVKSVLDLGSGTGNAAHYFASHGAHVIAVDGLQENIELANYPTICLDLSCDYVNTNVDLVHTQEFVEHVEEKFVGNIIKSFQSAKYVCMTHAVPGQDGYHHVNLKPPEYWGNLMTKNGFIFLKKDTERIRNLARLDGARHLEATGLVFYNSSK